MGASTFSSSASAQANTSEGGDDGTLAANPHVCERTSFSVVIQPALQAAGMKGSFSRSDVNLGGSQVDLSDCSDHQTAPRVKIILVYSLSLSR